NHHVSAGRRLHSVEQARDHAEARAVAARTPGPTTSGRTDSGMDAAGRVLGDETRGYTWNAAGRLAEARLPDGAVARYRYDHRGLRIGKQVGGHVVHALHDEHGQRLADLDERGRILREYIWLADHLVAVIDFDEPRVPHAEPATLAERIGRAIASAWRLVTGGGERIAYVHTDYLGAPVAMTD